MTMQGHGSQTHAHAMTVDERLFARYAHPDRVRFDVYILHHSFPLLQVQEGEHVANDGSVERLLRLSGTLPVAFRGSTYHIPVCIWVPLGYPSHIPFCYVTPTATMAIRPRHRHVDREGRCYLPLLNQWNPAEYTLLTLAQTLVTVFSVDPPVYSTTSPPAPAPLPPAQSPSAARGAPPPGAPRPPAPARPPPGDLSEDPCSWSVDDRPRPPPAPPSPVDPLGSRGLSPDSLFAGLPSSADVALREELAEKIRVNLRQFWPGDADAEGEALVQTERRAAEFADAMRRDAEETDAVLQTLAGADRALDAWLEENKEPRRNVDAEVVPADPLSAQIFDLVVEDAAIEDTLYVLSEGLHRGVLGIEEHLKEYRQLARQQFLLKALAMKIRGMQSP